MINTPGSILKSEREKQNTSIEEIAHRLKLSVHYLKAVEADNYQSIPAEIFVKAYIRLYAEALGLDSASILDLYHKKDSVTPIEYGEAGEDEEIFSYRPLAIMTVLLAIFTVTAVFNKAPIHSEKTIIPPAAVELLEKDFSPAEVIIPEPVAAPEEKANTPVHKDRAPVGKEEVIIPEPVAVPEEKADTPVHKDRVIPAGKEEVIIPEPVALPEEKVDTPVHKDIVTPAVKQDTFEKLSLRIEATELTWASVSIDGAERKEWQLRAGESLEFLADEIFRVKVGNAGGTKLYFNGSYLGELGDHGKIVDIVLPQ
jgi:transcriptional regulator with XRE-family HTH domain